MICSFRKEYFLRKKLDNKQQITDMLLQLISKHSKSKIPLLIIMLILLINVTLYLHHCTKTEVFHFGFLQ